MPIIKGGTTRTFIFNQKRRCAITVQHTPSLSTCGQKKDHMYTCIKVTWLSIQKEQLIWYYLAKANLQYKALLLITVKTSKHPSHTERRRELSVRLKLGDLITKPNIVKQTKQYWKMQPWNFFWHVIDKEHHVSNLLGFLRSITCYWSALSYSGNFSLLFWHSSHWWKRYE